MRILIAAAVLTAAPAAVGAQTTYYSRKKLPMTMVQRQTPAAPPAPSCSAFASGTTWTDAIAGVVYISYAANTRDQASAAAKQYCEKDAAPKGRITGCTIGPYKTWWRIIAWTSNGPPAASASDSAATCQ